MPLSIRVTISCALMACLLTSCGKAPAPATQSEETTATAPASTPHFPPPPEAPSSRTVYVSEAFQTESAAGTHDFPLGAAVTLLGIVDNDYLVELNGISVQISRSYFSEAPLNAPTPLPSPSPGPDQAETALADAPSPTPEPSASPEPTSVAPGEHGLAEDPLEPPPLSPEDRKIEELTRSIRDLNDRIRSVRESISSNQTTTNSSTDPAEVRKLKAKRDQLSKELTGIVKP